MSNPPTVLFRLADQRAVEGTEFLFIVPANTFTDADSDDTLSFAATLWNGTPLPGWLAFDGASRIFSGIPPAGAAGFLHIVVNATDGQGARVSDDFGIVVLHPVVGTAGDDTLYGTESPDVISGLGGHDTLRGDLNNDTLDGGTGNDTLDGGPGNDRYIFGRGYGTDTIANFNTWTSEADVVVLDAGIKRDDVRLVRQGDDLVLRLVDSTDQLILTRFIPDIYPVAYVQFADGTSWDVDRIQRLTDRFNAASAVNAPVTLHVQQNEWVRLSDIVTVSDAEGDRVWTVEMRDGNAAAGSGYLWLNGKTIVQGATAVADTSDLSSLWVRGGVNRGVDVIGIRIDDGFGWSEWKNFDLATLLPNRAPVATPTAATQYAQAGQLVSAALLFSAVDPDGDPIVEYEFWDVSPNVGFFRVNEQAQPNGQAISVSAATLNSTFFQAGTTQQSDMLFVRVNDGTTWSPWASWTMQTLRASNTAPVVSAPDTHSVGQGQWQRLSYVNVTDPEADPIVAFRVKDNNVDGTSARLWANGAYLPAGMAVKVSASSLDDVWLQGGANLGTDTIEIEAQDNMGAWSNLDTFELVTRLPNRAPVVTPGEATAGVVQGQTVGAMSLFTVTDADGDVPAWYEFWDSGPGGGFFRIGGSPQPSGAPLQISSAVSNPADVLYQGGAVPGSETVWLRVNDGTVWSPWVSRQVVTQRANNAAPVVDAPPTRNIEESQWQRLSFINVTDPEGDPIVAFRLKDTNGSEGSARLWANGSYLDSGVAVEVGASDLSGLWVQGGTANGTDTIEIEAQDNMGAWSNLDAFDLVTRFPNRAPVVTVTAATQSVSANQAVDAASLFSSSDPDMDAMTQYEFLDVGVGGGRFLVNGTAMGEGDGKNFTVTAAQLMQTTYTGGLSAGTETLWVRASDGTAWSAWKSWQMATLAA